MHAKAPKLRAKCHQQSSCRDDLHGQPKPGPLGLILQGGWITGQGGTDDVVSAGLARRALSATVRSWDFVLRAVALNIQFA